MKTFNKTFISLPDLNRYIRCFSQNSYILITVYTPKNKINTAEKIKNLLEFYFRNKEISVVETQKHTKNKILINFTLFDNETHIPPNEQIERRIKTQRIYYSQISKTFIDEFLGLLAHQWRQPLQAISTVAINLSINAKLNNEIDKNEIVKTMNFIQNETKKLSKILDEFISFKNSRISTNISSVIEIVKKMLITQLYSRKIEFNVFIREDFEIKGNIELFRQALLGIIFYLRDNLRGLSNKKINITAKNRTVYISSNIRPDLKYIFSQQKQDIRIFIAREIFINEFNSSFSIVTNSQNITFKIKLYKKKRHEQI